MWVKVIGAIIPTGTYSYNGHTYHVTCSVIEKSKDYYPNQYETIVQSGNIVHKDSVIVTMMIKGLARTIGVI